MVRFAWTDVFEDPALAKRGEAVLGEAEREMAARFRHEAAKRDYLAAHVLTRTLLAALSGARPSELRFRHTRGGRPELVAPPEAGRLRFSISHADRIALGAVATEGAVGADVESLRNLGPDPLGLAGIVCSRWERDSLRRLPPALRAERVLATWTLKEAIAKALGLGLDFDVASMTILWDSRGWPGVEFETGWPGKGSSWRLASVHLTPCHIASVALSGWPEGGLSVRFEEDRLPTPV